VVITGDPQTVLEVLKSGHSRGGRIGGRGRQVWQQPKLSKIAREVGQKTVGATQVATLHLQVQLVVIDKPDPDTESVRGSRQAIGHTLQEGHPVFELTAGVKPVVQKESVDKAGQFGGIELELIPGTEGQVERELAKGQTVIIAGQTAWQVPTTPHWVQQDKPDGHCNELAESDPVAYWQVEHAWAGATDACEVEAGATQAQVWESVLLVAQFVPEGHEVASPQVPGGKAAQGSAGHFVAVVQV
jgi:hypothetical protein